MIEQTVGSDFSEKRNDVDSRTYGKQAVICALLGIYWIVFFWNIWDSDRGVHALGFNATFFVLVALYLLGLGTPEKTLFHRKQLLWALPPLLIGLSYSFYENPFFKAISLFVVPLIAAWLYNYALIPDRPRVSFDRHIMVRLFARSHFEVALFIKPAWEWYLNSVSSVVHVSKAVVRRISLGIVALVVAGFAVVPLLYTADALFAERINALTNWPLRAWSWSTLAKIYVFLVVTIGFFSGILAWAKPSVPAEKRKDLQIDSLISGIMLSGVLAFYGLFIFVQIERIWIDDLPVNFTAVESLVKTGFWQLVALSFLNSVLFIVLYRKTSTFVQMLLTAFAVSSLLILFSAAQRMFLYVMYYGFSYEKFYASYVVVFCAVLLTYLAFASLRRAKTDVLKFFMLAFIWMFTAVAIIPVDKIILEANIALSEREESRYGIVQVANLSTDVFSGVDTLIEECNSEDSVNPSRWPNLCKTWSVWAEKQKHVVRKKEWHEHNLGTLLIKAKR